MNIDIVVVLAVVAIFIVVFVVKTKKKRHASTPTHRLSKLLNQRTDYLIFVGVPLGAPKEWTTAAYQGGDSLDVQGYGALPISGVRAFAVAYANGQLLDAEPRGLPLPDGLTGLYPASQADSDELRLEELEPGKAYVQVTYGPSATRPRDRRYYATTLKNISNERIRVQRFGGYRRRWKGWKLSNATRQFYSAEEFRQWYGLGSAEWIEPGQSAADPNNYGSPPVLWAYYCESESGQQFVVGGVLE